MFYSATSRNLWQAGILHRDVSVLIGKPDAKVGNRGVLIDWGMAIRLGRTETLASKDFNLESFISDKFYVLAGYKS